eukprot:m.155540 g.155540  ORF g.155540 m.155540 type:complete len:176 (+) comp24658_c0_seq2:1062-1589(+)
MDVLWGCGFFSHSSFLSFSSLSVCVIAQTASEFLRNAFHHRYGSVPYNSTFFKSQPPLTIDGSKGRALLHQIGKTNIGRLRANVQARDWIRKSFPEDVWLDLYYEDLLKDPQAFLQPICDALQVECSPNFIALAKSVAHPQTSHMSDHLVWPTQPLTQLNAGLKGSPMERYMKKL